MNWVFDLKKEVPKFLQQMQGEFGSGYYAYSYKNDLYNQTNKWNIGSAAFALKIYYTLSYKRNEEILAIGNHIKSFDQGNYIYDNFVFKKGFVRNLLSSIKNQNFSNVTNINYKRAEHRQCLSALNLYDLLPDEVYLPIPKSIPEVKKFLTNLNWSNPWTAGSHFSHLMFFYGLGNKQNPNKNRFKPLIDFAIQWVNKMQNEKDGAWYKSDIPTRIKVNGMMKILTGFDAVNHKEINYPDKIIDTCLSATQEKNACDHFNIIYTLYRASSYLKHSYRYSEIKQFSLKKLNDFRGQYYPKLGGFSFYANRNNDLYYNARIAKSGDTPDIHGTTLFLWGVAIICKLLQINKEVGLSVYKA